MKATGMVTDSTVLSRPQKLLTADLGGETVLYQHASGKYLKLDRVGARIWELCGEPISFQSLVGLLMEQFEVERTLCEAQTREFLLELKERDLLVMKN